MIKKALLITILSAISLAASGDFRTVSRAYEVSLSDLRVPVSSNGSVGVKNCADCDARSLRVTNTTRYIIDNEDIDLNEFRRQVLQVRDRDSKTVTVLHHLESDTVTLVSVNL